LAGGALGLEHAFAIRMAVQQHSHQGPAALANVR
jgi:hypothetical protein